MHSARLLMIFAAIAVIFLSNASAGTSISLDSTIDIPDRTVTYQGKTYEIQDIGTYGIGEPVKISIDVTDINSFQLSLLDKNKNLLWNHMVYYTDGISEVIMPADVITIPGTYAFAVLYQGEIKAVKPVVFSQYKLSVIPNTTAVAQGGMLQVKVSIVPDTSKLVKVVLVKNSTSLETAANRTGLGSYEAKIMIPGSAYGNFSLYAAMISDNIVMGYPEFTGISSGGNIFITQNPLLASDEPETSRILIVTLLFIGILLIVFKRLRS